MEDLQEQKPVLQLSFPRLQVVLIAYGVCILLAIAGVVLGVINFAAGPIRYPGFVLVLWLLTNIFLFGVVVLHLIYYLIKIVKEEAMFGMVFVLMGMFPIIGIGIGLLADKHFGVFSACALSVLVVCGAIDVVMTKNN